MQISLSILTTLLDLFRGFVDPWALHCLFILLGILFLKLKGIYHVLLRAGWTHFQAFHWSL